MAKHGDEEIRANELARVIKNEKTAGEEKLKDIEPSARNYRRFEGNSERPKLPRGVWWGVAGLVAIFIVGSVVSFFVVKQKVGQTLTSQVSALQPGVSDLQNLNPQAAAQKFLSLSASGTANFADVLSVFGFLFQGGKDIAGSLADLPNRLAVLAQKVTSLETDFFDFASRGQGAHMIGGLTDTRDTLRAIDADVATLIGAVGNFGGLAGLDAYLPLKAQMESAERTLTAFIPWFAAPAPHHLLILLENPSEMRPGGGFLGSYADVTIAAGNITDISVRDIADVDAEFQEKFIPPKPLQLEVKGFRPADANWFFDFPTSASETISFFEQSKRYAASGTTFDGAVAVLPDVIGDLLAITGPLTVTSTHTRFTADNFLPAIQKIVQQGQANSATYPKAAVGQLMQAIFARLASSTPAEQSELLNDALNWTAKKNITAYFKNPDLQNFLVSHGAAGDVYELPQNFNGDYLAIADANIRGDKSDFVIEQSVAYNADIAMDGSINTTLAIKRTHHGDRNPYWWYQTTSQDYLQVFVPMAATLTNVSGGAAKKISPPIDYARNGYSTDPLVAAIESSTQSLFAYPGVTMHEESGKEVFATWLRVAKGQSTKLELDYSHRAYVPPREGVQYEFVFEKQPGSNRSYDLTINAPLGYVFAENGIAGYSYQSDDPPGRLIVTLTLKKI